MRSYVVFMPGSSLRCELMARSRTAALITGAELLNLPVTQLRALQLHDFTAQNIQRREDHLCTSTGRTGTPARAMAAFTSAILSVPK